jgi:hypothetical protein
MTMRPAAKAGIVVAGYVAAVAVAWIALRVYIASTSGPDRQAYGGMYAFGDSLLFLGVAGVAAIPATGAALFFLRSHRGFWRFLSIGGLATAATAILAAVLFLAMRSATGHGVLDAWAMVTPLRILAAPLLALFFVLCGLFAPTRSARLCLASAAAIEVLSFVSVASTWWVGGR